MDDTEFCTRCGRAILPEKQVYLELRTSDNRWLSPGVMAADDPDNQGGFPFGAACAKRTLKNGQDW